MKWTNLNYRKVCLDGAESEPDKVKEPLEKTPVLRLLKRNGKVFVTIVPNRSREELMPIIQGKILEGSTIHTNDWKAYDDLILNDYNHYQAFHHENKFARGKSHVNGIECFWSYAKRRFPKFKGLTDD